MWDRESRLVMRPGPFSVFGRLGQQSSSKEKLAQAAYPHQKGKWNLRAFCPINALRILGDGFVMHDRTYLIKGSLMSSVSRPRYLSGASIWGSQVSQWLGPSPRKMKGTGLACSCSIFKNFVRCEALLVDVPARREWFS